GTGFTAVTDSTLDLTVGDINGDGRPDVYTAPGESGSFTDRLYFGDTAAIDTLPPVISQPPAPPPPPNVPAPAGFPAAAPARRSATGSTTTGSPTSRRARTAP